MIIANGTGTPDFSASVLTSLKVFDNTIHISEAKKYIEKPKIGANKVVQLCL